MSDALLDLWVPGEPRPEPRPRAVAMPLPPGSQHGRKCRCGARWAGSVHPDENDTTSAWRSAIKTRLLTLIPPGAPLERQGPGPWEGPLRVDLTFFLSRPLSHHVGNKAERELKADAPVFHVFKPDRDNLDKLVLDALTKAGCWSDDCVVVTGVIEKRYDEGRGPGCRIEVNRWLEKPGVAAGRWETLRGHGTMVLQEAE